MKTVIDRNKIEKLLNQKTEILPFCCYTYLGLPLIANLRIGINYCTFFFRFQYRVRLYTQ